MKEFNLKLAKAGHPVCTRDGRPVRLLDFDYKGDDEPIVAIIINPSNGKERLETYSIDGTWDKHNSLDSGIDLMMASVKHEGWVNIYKSNNAQEDLDPFALYQMQQGIFETEDKALGVVKKSIKYSTYVATVKIEWEE